MRVYLSLIHISFAFFEYPGKKFLFYLTIGTMIIPTDVLLVQNYFTVSGMNLINTYTVSYTHLDVYKRQP